MVCVVSRQAQVTHIGCSFHLRTPYIMRVPPNVTARTVFWVVNGFLLVFPQLFALRCMLSRQFFTPETATVPAARTKKE